MNPVPVTFTWMGDGMQPLPRFAKVCDRQFVVGETYTMIVHEARSTLSHNHYFATVKEAWLNLPEDQAPHFPTEEHLRKFALIKAGYTDKRSIACASKAEAQRIAAFITPMDPFSIVIVSECLVTVYTAQSQSLKAMGKRVFQESKDKVLEILSLMIGTTPADLSANAEKVA